MRHKTSKEMPNNSDEIEPKILAEYLKKPKKSTSNLIILDCRNFIDYNNAHIQNSINAFYSKLMRKRAFTNQVNKFINI